MTTLAEVLEADANAYARAEATPGELEEANRWAALAHLNALQYILANREALERFELERREKGAGEPLGGVVRGFEQTTLGDVLRSLDVDHPLEFATMSAEFFNARREWLNRCEWELDVRKSLGLNEHWTIITQRGAEPPKRFTATQQSILVGADWRPEWKP